jgi:hypothetical protein
MRLESVGLMQDGKTVWTMHVPGKAKRHVGGVVSYGLLALAVYLFVTATTELRVDLGLHAAIGVGAAGAIWLGGKVCAHPRHQFCARLALLLLEAWATVQVIG